MAIGLLVLLLQVSVDLVNGKASLCKVIKY